MKETFYTGWATHLKACGSNGADVIRQVSDVVCVFELWSKRRRAADAARAQVVPLLDEPTVAAVNASAEEPAYEVADVEELPKGTFIVSIQRGGAFKRLHCFGVCSLVPGVDYKSWESLGMSEPPVSSYSAKCKNCFAQVSGRESGSVSSSHSSSR